MNPYFSVFKLIWLIENVPEVTKAVQEERCMFGTMDSWLIWVIILYNIMYIIVNKKMYLITLIQKLYTPLKLNIIIDISVLLHADVFSSVYRILQVV